MGTLSSYDQASDEQLVALYQRNGDQQAFTTLYERYRPKLDVKAGALKRKSPRVDYTKFRTKMDDKFMMAVEQFDVERRVQFADWLKVKTYNVDREVIASQYKRPGTHRGKRTRELRKDTPLYIDQLSDDSDKDVDGFKSMYSEALSYEADFDGISDQESYVRDRGGEDDLKVLHLKMAGHSFEDIARALGRKGSSAALNKYGQRAVNRVRQLLVDFYTMVGAPEYVY